MLLSIFYRNECAKSQFLRIAIREMSWDFQEYDLDSKESESTLIRLKQELGSGEEPITPAIQTKEAYSHELFGMLEYLFERNPSSSMLPDQPATRLVSRTILHRVFRDLIPIWNAYKETGDATKLISYHDDSIELIEAVVQGIQTYRGNPDTPSYVDILFAVFTLEVARHKKIASPVIRSWLAKLSARESFSKLIPQFQAQEVR